MPLLRCPARARPWCSKRTSPVSLSNLVAELRAAFEDDAANPRLLRTVRRFGYAFIGGQALAVAVLAELEYVGLRRGVAAA